MKTRRWFGLLFFAALSLSACHIPKENNIMELKKTIGTGLPEWAKSANIYEVNIRQYTPEGTFNAFRKHLPRLKSMGVDILWFMPVYPISNTKKKGSLGSYYAVSDFRATNPSFGTIDEFKEVIDEAHGLGMKVVLDWVPNHTGWDHVWIKQHPDFYTKDASGNIIDPLNEHGQSMGWSDVADLNYHNQALRNEMVSDMIFWLKNYHIDGFRQDMAMLVPLDFWKEAIQKLRAVKPDLFMLAESEEHDHLNADCFHVVYAWSLHHILNDIAKGRKNVNDIDNWYAHEKPKASKGLYLQFTSNHDENSWSGSEIERMGEAHKAFAVLVNTIDGVPLTYSGQEEPMAKRLEFFEKDDIEFKDYEHQSFYQTLNTLKHRNPALFNLPFGGQVSRILKNDNVYSFVREKDGNKVIVMINLSKHTQSILSDVYIKGREIFSEKEINIVPGQSISLMPWEYWVITQ